MHKNIYCNHIVSIITVLYNVKSAINLYCIYSSYIILCMCYTLFICFDILCYMSLLCVIYVGFDTQIGTIIQILLYENIKHA